MASVPNKTRGSEPLITFTPSFTTKSTSSLNYHLTGPLSSPMYGVCAPSGPMNPPTSKSAHAYSMSNLAARAVASSTIDFAPPVSMMASRHTPFSPGHHNATTAVKWFLEIGRRPLRLVTAGAHLGSIVERVCTVAGATMPPTVVWLR